MEGKYRRESGESIVLDNDIQGMLKSSPWAECSSHEGGGGRKEKEESSAHKPRLIASLNIKSRGQLR